MKIYDDVIRQCLKLLENVSEKNLNIYNTQENSKIWKCSIEHNMILKKEMAYELGGSGHYAISTIAFTGDELVNRDEIILYGQDLNNISSDRDFARITLINFDDSKMEDENRIYQAMRRIDYSRYHIYPCGYMMRISTASDREAVRIGKKELREGLDFEKIGNLFLREYHKHKEVKYVKMIFVTTDNFNYNELRLKAEKADRITESLNKIFNNLIMDCTTCSLKNVCDEVEGLRELHFGMKNRSK